MVGRVKALKNFRNRSRGSPLRGDSLPKSGNFWYFSYRVHSHTSAAIEVKFCTAKRTQVPVGPDKFELNGCNESPLWGEKPDFWPVSKFNTGRMPRLVYNCLRQRVCSMVIVSDWPTVFFTATHEWLKPPFIWFVVDLLYNKLYNKSTTSWHVKMLCICCDSTTNLQQVYNKSN